MGDGCIHAQVDRSLSAWMYSCIDGQMHAVQMHKGIDTYAFTYMHWACNKIKYGSRLHLKSDRNNVCFTLQFCRTFVSKILAQWLRVVKLAFLVKIIVVYAGMDWWDKTVTKVCWSTDSSVYLLVCVLYESQVSTKIVQKQTNYNFRIGYCISSNVAGRWKRTVYR